jgi:hypothetical protein
MDVDEVDGLSTGYYPGAVGAQMALGEASNLVAVGLFPCWTGRAVEERFVLYTYSPVSGCTALNAKWGVGAVTV